ncbi:MAG: YbhB/YbcL family Raf kinase inhibitor-like protein [Deltaproteobacteria bacterium]|nr:YbhB/YbcL family Raf kinase inhibitor-like protein [Deltaproteobacteria bacterium]
MNRLVVVVPRRVFASLLGVSLVLALAACAGAGCSSATLSSPSTDDASSDAPAASDGSSPETGGDPADGGSPLEGGEGGVDASAPFVLTSTAFVDKGTLPVRFTCDGDGVSPPLAWGGAPPGTVGYALLMTTLAKDGLKWNWVLYDLSSSVRALTEASAGVGTAGLTSDGPNLAYSPPCSQGPGAKTYTFTVYALSGAPTLPADPHAVTGAVLETAIEPLTLAKSALSVSYTR